MIVCENLCGRWASQVVSQLTVKEEVEVWFCFGLIPARYQLKVTVKTLLM
jgi:hypothetical protein